MSPIEKPFVIILDEDADGSPGQWRAVHKDRTLALARLHCQYTEIVATYPRDRYKAVKLESKALTHSLSGTVKHGAIYRMNEIRARIGAAATSMRKAARPARISVRAAWTGSIHKKKKAARRQTAKSAPIITRRKPRAKPKKRSAPILTKKRTRSGKR